MTDLKAAIMETRPCYFNGAWVDTPNYDRSQAGRRRARSRARRSSANTTRPRVLLPGHYAEVDEHGNILIWPNAKGK